MLVRIVNWVRSLSVFAPKPAATPVRYRLEDLLEGMTPEAMHDAFVWDGEKAREIVE